MKYLSYFSEDIWNFSLNFRILGFVCVELIKAGSMTIRVVIHKPRRRWEDSIKMDLQEVGGGRGDWMELAQNRDRWRALVGTVRNFRVP